MTNLLLEIGCENLPPLAIRAAFEQLRDDASKRLAELRLPAKEIYTTGTPRRLVLVVRGLADAQTSEMETITGPPWSKAFGEDGKPTRAAEGFAKSQGIGLSKLKRVPTDRGDYLGFTRRMKSTAAAPLLKEMLPDLIAALKFPKLMHWEPSGMRFARPIRWIVAMLGDKVIRFEIAGVKSGSVSYTVPWIRPDKVKLRSATGYKAAMKGARVIVDHDERRQTLEKLAATAARKEKLKLIADPVLFDELTFMLEDPRPLVGSFDERYLSLPPEVVVTAMKSHQRYLAFTNARGKLVPRFLTFTEGRVGAPSVVRSGNEKVLKARLEDALFYWQEDLKAGMDGLAAKLRSIVFIEGLGSLADKSDRLSDLALAVARMENGDGADEDAIRRAAKLCKADLASEMIKDGKEFTLMQGLIGSYYARESREPDEVVEAIREHYRPRSPGDEAPRTSLGALLSIADRLDTMAGCFLAGFVPTGSQDPYALRRQANGLLRLLESRPNVALSPLLERAVGNFGVEGKDEARARLVEFMQTRMSAFLKDKGIAYDVVAAVSRVAWDAPAIAAGRARAMAELRGNEPFELLITGARRVGNILADDLKVFGAPWELLREAFLGTGSLTRRIAYDKSKFDDDAETSLHGEIATLIPRLEGFDELTEGKAILSSLSGLGGVIDRYFDSVLVNVPDDALRTNRHHFLAAVFALFAKYADFSQIVEEGP